MKMLPWQEKTGAKNEKKKEKKFGQANACNPKGLKSYIK